MMKKIFAILMVTLMLFSLVACKTTEPEESSPPAASQAPAKTPAPASSAPEVSEEKILYLGNTSGGTFEGIETPWQNQGLPTMVMFRTLFMAETDLNTVNPDLATGYTVSADGLTYTITLAEGNKWSDGEEITAEDVAFSIKTNLRAAVSNGIYTSAFSKITGAAQWKDSSASDLAGLTVDGNVITIKLDSAHNSMPAVLAQFAILPEHILADADPLTLENHNEFWSNPVTSGAFKVTEWEVGNYAVLEHNEFYTGQVPKIEKIVISQVADLITGAKSGQIDYLNTNSVEIMSELNKLSNMTMYPVDILFFRYFICNMEGVDGKTNPVMQNPKVRQAILHAIDRETLAAELFPGLANVVQSGVSSTSPNFNGTSFEYNPEKAKQLLAEANYDFNHTFRILYYYSDQGSIDFMDAIAYYLGEVGMDVQIIQSSQGTQDLFQTREYDVGYKGLSAFNISEWYGEYSSSNANFKNIFGGNTAFDELNSKLAVSVSAEDTAAVLNELQDLENELLFKLPLFTLGNNVFVNTDRVVLPENAVFGNPWYKTNIGFADWDIVG